jgi:aarF domain-containing kinase
MAKGTAPPTSVWSRSATLIKLGAGLAKREVEGRLGVGEASRDGASESETRDVRASIARVRTQVAQAKEIVEALGQLKGAAMKAGQLMSMELRDVLPPEVIAVLQKLQDAGRNVPWSDIQDILAEELGAAMQRLEIEPVALASASIGQVHRATWTRADGVQVAIVLKVQFRGIADTIDSDLAVLERIARIFLSVQLKNIDLGAVFEELKSVLKRETDYEEEAKSLCAYRAFAERVPGLAVPEVFPEISTKKVLALSYEPGLRFDAFLSEYPDTSTRNAVACQLMDLYFKEFFEWGIVQTDANFANFLFRAGPGPAATPEIQLVLLDFGATRTYAPEFRESYRVLLRACFEDRRAEAIATAESLSLIDPREELVCKESLIDLIQLVLRVFRKDAQPVDFTDRSLVTDSSEAVKSFYKSLRYSPPPAQLLFLHRKLGGVYSMGKALGAKIDLTPYWQRLDAPIR